MFEQLNKYRFYGSLIILIIYYVVGITLLKTSENNQEIIALTPFTLVFTTVLLLINHQNWSKRFVFATLLIAVLGFFVEVIGTKTGFPFGFYFYSDVLGVKAFNTPLVMGVNWIMLVYAGTLFFHPMRIPNWLKPILTGILLVFLDIFIEPFAIKWNLWQWDATVPPIQNYLSWTIIAIFFSFLLNKSLTNSMRNKMVVPVLLIQFLFFLILAN